MPAPQLIGVQRCLYDLSLPLGLCGNQLCWVVTLVTLCAGVSPDNDACIAAAVGIIRQSPPAEPVPSALFAHGDIAALALS